MTNYCETDFEAERLTQLRIDTQSYKTRFVICFVLSCILVYECTKHELVQHGDQLMTMEDITQRQDITLHFFPSLPSLWVFHSHIHSSSPTDRMDIN